MWQLLSEYSLDRVSFRTAAGLINEMVEARNENRLSLYLRQFKKIDLLILDELGYVTFDLAGAELLFQLLATRYETMSAYCRNSRSDYPPCNDPEYERTEFSEKVERRELYTQGDWLV